MLHFLKRHDDQQVDLRTLVDAVSAWEYETPADDLSWKERKRVYTALRQSHLPKLAEAGAVEYDRSRGRVELTDDAREYQLYLEYVPAHDIPWSHLYLGLTGVGVVLIGLVHSAVFPFAELTGMALSVILVVMFGLSAIAHVYYVRQHRLGVGEPPR